MTDCKPEVLGFGYGGVKITPGRLLVAALVCALLSACGLPGEGGGVSAGAENRVLVAVASNFVATLAELKPAFEASAPYRLEMAPGSTGKLYAQIVAGAPFDIFPVSYTHLTLPTTPYV